MDTKFLNNRIHIIGRYQWSKIRLPREKACYEAYMFKLKCDLIYFINTMGKNRIYHAISYVNRFQEREIRRSKSEFFMRRKLIIKNVCNDVKDVLNSMRRWEND